MPFINVKLTTPAPSKEIQNKIAKEITDVIVNNLKKLPERTVICFEEIEPSHFYFGGKSIEELRREK
ncbi:4-oxalocrotonate tautomerase family enzyme [Campylobacter blaseri]|uniref:4-oxalocrotonate tautomerase-like domain-containing protein n=1 Tax=Campylobacter blaseri TaxID=2042961 RepID=A0A2P8R127_9BACT|nr:4-oxalocrotonate tautomerase family protein [Campylobacter blaseri]PSM52202.1 hypothetical protein CQ405_03880 [Campylobacter blaseri]PSM53968.1 hypothetical protein CRN67_03880 [Campylobacter blaseri]QKF85406.1 4-oxalocrotonate tautomerase family enzyme [Campylobacter blaseri]